MLCMRYCWEPQHPQTLIEHAIEDISVPVVSLDVEQVMGETTLYADAPAWGSDITLVTAAPGLADGDPIGVYLNNGVTHWSFVDGTPTELGTDPLIDSDGEYIYDSALSLILAATDTTSVLSLSLGSPVSYLGDAGNAVYLPHLNNESWS